MVNKNNFASNKNGLVAMILCMGRVYCPGSGIYDTEEFCLPATQEQAEKCQAIIDESGMYYNHEIQAVVENDFDVLEWREKKKMVNNSRF